MERAKGKDAIHVGALIPMREVLKAIRKKWTIEKFHGDFKTREEAMKAGAPFGKLEFEGNLLLNEGINAIWTLICGGSETAYNNANARIGVGNSNAAADASQTALQGASTAFKAMDATYPTYATSQKATFRSTFGSTEGNFAWEEITVDNGSSANKNLNRKVQSMGTKAAGTTWVATLEITLS
jgi:hypothetical protein